MTTKIVCVHSLTAHGEVGLKPFITHLGAAVAAVPSLLLTGPGNMPGCRRFATDLAGLLDGTLAASAAQGEKVWLFVGYLAHAGQVEVIERALADHAATITGLIVDPVCGDNGRAYVAPELLAAWPRLLARAEWVFPNLTEVELLTDQRGDDAVAEWRRRHPRQHLIVTGWPAGDGIGTRYHAPDGTLTEQVQPLIAGHSSGTGDLFAAIWLREWLLRQTSPANAMSTAAAAVLQARQTACDPVARE